MPRDDHSLTINELKGWLLKELLRADTSFQLAQLEARQALARDLIPGDERVVVNALEISEISLNMALSRVRPCWLLRLWQGFCRFFCLRQGDFPAPAAEPRFHFVAAGTGDLRIDCRFRRRASGEFAVETSLSEGEAHNA